jgi:DNA-binding CsgD family transcriptional regulator/GAF domain-containing protein
VKGDEEFFGVLIPLVAADSLDELQDEYLDWVGDHVDAFAAGIYLHDRATGGTPSARVRGLSKFYVTHYERHGRHEDPVVIEAIRRRRVCDDTTVATADEWDQLPIVNHVFREHGMAHVLCAPMVNGSEVIGTLNFARHESGRPFDEEDRSRAAVAAAMVTAATIAVSARVEVEHERDRAVAGLDLAGHAVVVTDLERGERHFTPYAREIRRRLGPDRELLDRVLDEASNCEFVVGRPDGAAPPERYSVTTASDPLRPGINVTVLRPTGEATVRLPDTIACNLTQRERDVATLVAAGLGVSEVADRLFISANTVKFHLRSVYQKLGIGSKVELVRLALT